MHKIVLVISTVQLCRKIVLLIIIMFHHQNMSSLQEIHIFLSNYRFSSVLETPAILLQWRPDHSTLEPDSMPECRGSQLQCLYKPRSGRPLSLPPSRLTASSVFHSPSPQTSSLPTCLDSLSIPAFSKWSVNKHFLHPESIFLADP